MSASRSPSNQRKILLLMSGSIAAYKTCQLISKLVQNHFQVQVACTPSTFQFVGAATLEGLTGKPVLSDTFTQGQMMSHIHLIRDADLILAAPATASLINRMAAGIGDDLPTTLFLAHDFQKPFLVAPAMNTKMYLHPTTQKSLRSLSEMGVRILEAASGVLACGETGLGRLLEPDLLFNEITKTLKPRTQKILITAGGTQEAIDDVRVISNKSTGRTGYKLAEYFYQQGADVFLLHAENAQIPDFMPFKHASFRNYSDLQQALQKELGEKSYSHVLHAAAVSDYSIDNISSRGQNLTESKLPSGHHLQLNLKPNPKIIEQIRSYSRNPDIKVVGFKLTSHANVEEIKTAVAKVLNHSDWVIHNDIEDIDPSKNLHRFTLWSRNEQIPLNNFQDLTAILTEKLI